MSYQQILKFWFEEATHEQRFAKDDKFDALIKERFSEIHQQAAKGECFDWRQSADGALAEIIILDQFSRNLFREQAQAFAYDGMALALAQTAVANEYDQMLNVDRRLFMYLPYMHSESVLIHKQALPLFSQDSALQDGLKYEQLHKRIIDRFGRYPHRNQALGRESTAEELAFLQEPNSSF